MGFDLGEEVDLFRDAVYDDLVVCPWRIDGSSVRGNHRSPKQLRQNFREQMLLGEVAMFSHIFMNLMYRFEDSDLSFANGILGVGPFLFGNYLVAQVLVFNLVHIMFFYQLVFQIITLLLATDY